MSIFLATLFAILRSLFGIAYLIVGILIIFATAQGIDLAFGTGIFSFIIAAFLAYIPLVGAGFGVYGAVNVWDWGVFQAVLVFYWYVPVYLLFMLFGVFAENSSE